MHHGCKMGTWRHSASVEEKSTVVGGMMHSLWWGDVQGVSVVMSLREVMRKMDACDGDIAAGILGAQVERGKGSMREGVGWGLNKVRGER